MLRYLKSIVLEISCCIAVAILSLCFVSHEDYISADGIGYYDYLPSIFIHQDFVRNSNASINLDRISKLPGYVDFNQYKVDKYYCGSAVLMSPFFAIAYLFSDDSSTGYESQFKYAILISAIFYLFLTLVGIKFLLLQFRVRLPVVRVIQIAIVFSTGTLYYTAALPAFSHIYSLFAITCFFCFAKKYATENRVRFLFLMGIMFGVVIIIRPINVLAILFLPFILGSQKEIQSFFKGLIKHKYWTLLALLVFSITLSVQAILWYMQTNQFIVYSYQNEYFDFTNPHFIEILISFRKGLFIYTPILLLILLSILTLIRHKKFFIVVTFLLPAVVLTYVLSCWWDWVYGYSYGLRAFIDYYAIFFLLIAVGLNESPKILISANIFIASTVFLNLVQTWQYHNYILHWYTMDFDKYCKVFLRTSKQFKGILWKEVPSTTHLVASEIPIITKVQQSPWTADTLLHQSLLTITNNPVEFVQIRLKTNFSTENTSFVELNVMDSSGRELKYSRSVYVLQFSNGALNGVAKGEYWYDLRQLSFDSTDKILVRTFTEDHNLQLDCISLVIYEK